MKWSAILFGIFIIAVVILANLDMLGILGFINRIPYGDKFGHFILYGILTLLVDLAIIDARKDISPSLIALRVAFVLALSIGLEEYSQQFFASRTADWVDLIFSYFGVACFSFVALRIKH